MDSPRPAVRPGLRVVASESIAGGRSPRALVQRLSGWIQRWHGGQLATFVAAVVIVPWQIGVWRQALISTRLEGFLDPGGAHLGWAGRVVRIMLSFVLPLLAVIVTAIWITGRARRTPVPRD